MVGPTPFGWVDLSGNNLTATPTGAQPTYNQPPLAPASSQKSSLFTAASSQFLQRSHDAKLNLADKFTIECWIGYRSNSAVQYLLSKDGSVNAYNLSITNLGQIQLRGPFGVIVATSSVALSGNHHVALTKDGATTKIYIDGVDRTTAGSNVTFTNSTDPLHIGRVLTSAYFNSTVSDLALYNKALTAAQVQAHYAGSLPTYMAATLSGELTLTGRQVRRQRPVPSDLAGITTMLATPVRRQFTGSNLTSTSDLTGIIIRRQRPQATLESTLTVTAVQLPRRGMAATLQAEGTMTVQPAGRFIVAATLTAVLTMKVGRGLAPIPLPPALMPPEIVAADQVSPRLIATLARSHQLATLIQVLDPVTGEVAATLDTVHNGEITLDANANIRGRMDLELTEGAGRELIPFRPTDLLTPYGTEIRVARGARFPDGTAEVVSLGIFRLRQVDSSDTGDSLTIRLTGMDRWSRITDARFERTWVIPKNTNRITAILQTVQDIWPDVPYDLPSTTMTTPQLMAERGDDRGDFIRDIAVGMGLELYFDGMGVLRAQPIASTTDQERWSLVEGQGGLLLEANRSWDAERVYNKVIASGEPIDDSPVVCAQVWDDNPNSPTYFHGPFGQRPRFYVSGMLQTQQQALAAAAGILAKAVGTSQKIDFGSIVNPAIEPGTVARIRRGRLGLDEKHVIDTVRIPLSATEPMTGATRILEVAGE